MCVCVCEISKNNKTIISDVFTVVGDKCTGGDTQFIHHRIGCFEFEKQPNQSSYFLWVFSLLDTHKHVISQLVICFDISRLENLLIINFDSCTTVRSCFVLYTHGRFYYQLMDIRRWTLHSWYVRGIKYICRTLSSP